jgi:hypothetical protein
VTFEYQTFFPDEPYFFQHALLRLVSNKTAPPSEENSAVLFKPEYNSLPF